MIYIHYSPNYPKRLPKDALSFETEVQHFGTVSTLQLIKLAMLQAIENGKICTVSCQSGLLLSAVGYWIRQNEIASNKVTIIEHLATASYNIELDVKGETIQPLADSYEYDFNFRFNQGLHKPE